MPNQGMDPTELGCAILLAEKLLVAQRISAEFADNLVPPRPGYYAIFIDRPDSLGQPFGQILRSRRTCLIYTGIATRSLRQRLVNQDLRHKKPSTFFRGLGALLGFRPPMGSLVGKGNQDNYRFSPADTREIISWINEHLSVSWVDVVHAYMVLEKDVINTLRPLMNTKSNPDRIPELAQLRDECRRIARSTGVNR